MKPLLEVTATEARKNIYKLIDQVSKGELRVVIFNTDTNSKVLMIPLEHQDHEGEIQRDSKIVAETAGAIQTSGYKKNEFELAKQVFIKQNRKNYEK